VERLAEEAVGDSAEAGAAGPSPGEGGICLSGAATGTRAPGGGGDGVCPSERSDGCGEPAGRNGRSDADPKGTVQNGGEAAGRSCGVPEPNVAMAVSTCVDQSTPGGGGPPVDGAASAVSQCQRVAAAAGRRRSGLQGLEASEASPREAARGNRDASEGEGPKCGSGSRRREERKSSKKTDRHALPARNKPCPCGSGKRYKACCTAVAAAEARRKKAAIAAADACEGGPLTLTTLYI
jgi:SEC-C motif